MPDRTGDRSELPLLGEMGEELHRLFVAEEQRPRMLSARWRHNRFDARLAVVFIALSLAATTVALAANGLLSGSPVKPSYRLVPTSGSGVPIGSSVELLAISAADPAGGPPWGLRLMKTTRGLACLQFGRLVDGKLSVLGQDGAFGDDHRFHELPADVFDDLGCAAPDAHGNLFISISKQDIPASADEEACSPPVQGAVPQHGEPICRVEDERTLFYGALGPLAKSITYTLDGRRSTVPTVGPDGAYLIVTYAGPHADPDVFGGDSPNGSSILPTGHRQPIRRIVYRDGAICDIGAHADIDNRGRACSPAAFVETPVGSGHVRTSLHVAVEDPLPRPPFTHREKIILVSFTARKAVTRAGEDYVAHLRFPCNASETVETPHDVAAGKTVTLDLGLSVGPPGSKPCSGTYQGKVTYVEQPDYSAQSRGLPSPTGSTVGEFSLRVP
jgi:hypothetical protein